VCTPIDESEPSSARAALARFTIRLDEWLPTAVAKGVRVSNALGEVLIDVQEPRGVQVRADIGAAEADVPAADPSAAAATCYKVLVLDDPPREWTFDDGRDGIALGDPVRLCATDATSTDVELCYRMRDPIPDSSTEWITSAFGSESIDLGAVDEICLPSTVVSNVPD
jgi:hypothetical protein